MKKEDGKRSRCTVKMAQIHFSRGDRTCCSPDGTRCRGIRS
jgi:hypothetical protein